MKYEIGEIVYLITDTDQRERIITGILKRPFGLVYYLCCGVDETTHYEIEFCRVKNYKL